MGDPLRYQEIYELNRDTVQPDGGRLVTPETWLEDGWTLRLPADAAIPAPASASTPPAQAGTVIVKPGDTRSQIAQDHLDDATRYPEIAAQNHITDPDRIDVGEIIVLPEPGGASPDAAAVPPGTAPVGTPPADTAPTTATAGDPSRPPVDPQPGAPVSPPATDAPSTVGADRAADPADTPTPTLTAAAPAPVPSAAATPPFPTSAPEPGTAATPAAAQPQPSTPAAADADDHSTAAVLAGLTALTAGAAWSALRAVRRRGHRRRVPGRQAAPARLGAARAERQLREKALAADAGWLNAALRALAAALATQPAPAYPDVVAAYLEPDQLRLQLAAPVPAPAPFTAVADGWVLPVTAELPTGHPGAGDEIAPLPTLVSIGSRGDRTVLLDLERTGALCLQGDRLACRELMNHLVLELAHNDWSDGLLVSLTGWGSDLTALNPDRLVHIDSIAAVLRQLRTRLAETRQSESSLDTDVLAGRVLDVAGDSWMPQVLLIDATGDEEQDIVALQDTLREMADVGRATTAVVLSGAPSVGGVAELTVTAQGELRFPELWGPEPLAAARLSDAEIAEITELFAVAEQVDMPVPAATETTSWAQDMDASGALLNPADGPQHVDGASDDADPGDQPGQEGKSRVVPIRAISPAAAAQLASVLAADPQLDADLAEWTGEVVLRPRISVLGPVQVRAAGTAPPNRVARISEVVTYLALHMSGVTADKFVTDLWPADRQPKAGTRRQLIFDVRKWMGRDPETGEQFLPNANDGLYRLTTRLLDADLLRRLRKRAHAKAGVNDCGGALEDYRAALGLVRGRPMPEAAGQSYPWLANLDRMDDRRLPAWVTDTAHEAAEIAFGINDLDTARWAADIGHLCDKDSDVPLCDLMLAAQAAGSMEIAQALAYQILDVNDATVPEECPPRTFEVIHRVFPAGLRPLRPDLEPSH